MKKEENRRKMKNNLKKKGKEKIITDPYPLQDEFLMQ